MQRVLFIQPQNGGARRPQSSTPRNGSVSSAAVLLAFVIGGTVSIAPAAGPTRDEPADFTVIGVDANRGHTIAATAARIRQEAFSSLLGIADPDPWTAPCEIHVHDDPASFAAALGGPPAAARGATSLEFSAERVTRRRIDVRGDGGDVVPDALAHEIVHVVLADRFIAAAPPRWADEGLALLFDPAQKQRDHDADFRDALRRGLAWRLDDLLALENYPRDSGRQRVFYGQSAALVRWLIARRDPATFVRFVDECGTLGMPAALERHYDLGSIDLLELAWKEVAPIDRLSMTYRPATVAAD